MKKVELIKMRLMEPVKTACVKGLLIHFQFSISKIRRCCIVISLTVP